MVETFGVENSRIEGWGEKHGIEMLCNLQKSGHVKPGTFQNVSF